MLFTFLYTALLIIHKLYKTLIKGSQLHPPFQGLGTTSPAVLSDLRDQRRYTLYNDQVQYSLLGWREQSLSAIHAALHKRSLYIYIAVKMALAKWIQLLFF